MHVSCPSLVCDINQQKCIQELFSDYFLLPGHTLALGSSRAKPEHVQPSFFQSGNLVGSQRVVKKRGGGYFHCVCTSVGLCVPSFCMTHTYTHTHTLDFGVYGGGRMFSAAEHGDCLVYKEQLS